MHDQLLLAKLELRQVQQIWYLVATVGPAVDGLPPVLIAAPLQITITGNWIKIEAECIENCASAVSTLLRQTCYQHQKTKSSREILPFNCKPMKPFTEELPRGTGMMTTGEFIDRSFSRTGWCWRLSAFKLDCGELYSCGEFVLEKAKREWMIKYIMRSLPFVHDWLCINCLPPELTVRRWRFDKQMRDLFLRSLSSGPGSCISCGSSRVRESTVDGMQPVDGLMRV